MGRDGYVCGLYSTPLQKTRFFQMGKLRPWGGKRICPTGYNTEIFLFFKHFLPQTLDYPGQLPTEIPVRLFHT